ncbi:uncharacterized protein HD556DRAFT_1303617 [Suillus plorans]|uniref:Uncharacterized protein n=1 Tax=Suillus plorans TaxID=116603 RepID=A0A9P7J5G8_9AGAM|nr:uncharacterized protein HD556DRAFT_1303617 [Suillus plorans]KAG1803545.1 hypothetical protein HD556DRAFT_1303617 [Suillus plorans]
MAATSTQLALAVKDYEKMCENGKIIELTVCNSEHEGFGNERSEHYFLEGCIVFYNVSPYYLPGTSNGQHQSKEGGCYCPCLVDARVIQLKEYLHFASKNSATTGKITKLGYSNNLTIPTYLPGSTAAPELSPYSLMYIRLKHIRFFAPLAGKQF